MKKRLLSIIALSAMLFAFTSCDIPPFTNTFLPIAPDENSDTTPNTNEDLDTEKIVHTEVSSYLFEDMEYDLLLLKEKYPERLSVESLGKSADGRDIYLAVFGNKNASKKIIIHAGIHGREYLTPLLVMNQLEFYLDNYEKNTFNGIEYSNLFEDIAFYIIPMANPDGNALAQNGISAIHSDELRKIILDTHQSDMHLYDNIQSDINTYLKFWKANARGVDLNRNFNSNWAKIGGSTIPCFRSYKGPSAASEPETKIFEALTKKLQGLVAVICVHSQGEVIYWDCGQPDEIRIPTLSLASLASDVTGYKIVYSQNVDASYSDWCVLEQNVPAITIEIGNGSGNSLLEFEQFDSIWQKNHLLWAALAENYS